MCAYSREVVCIKKHSVQTGPLNSQIEFWPPIFLPDCIFNAPKCQTIRFEYLVEK